MSYFVKSFEKSNMAASSCRLLSIPFAMSLIVTSFAGMLQIGFLREDVLVIQVFHDLAYCDMLHSFTNCRLEGYCMDDNYLG